MLVMSEYDYKRQYTLSRWLWAIITIMTVLFLMMVVASMTVNTVLSIMIVVGENDYKDSTVLPGCIGRVLL